MARICVCTLYTSTPDKSEFRKERNIAVDVFWWRHPSRGWMGGPISAAVESNIREILQNQI